MNVCLSAITNVALAQDNNNLYKLCVGHFFVKADTCRWVYQKFRYTAKEIKIEPVHEISNNVVCATSKASDQPAHTRSLIRAFACRLNIL